jgi:hypothetical protein
MPSKAYIHPETPTVWTHSGGDKLLDLRGSLNQIHIGAYLDLGAAPRAYEYEVTIAIDGFDTANQQFSTILLFFAESNDGVNFSGLPTTAPTASAEGVVTRDQSRNMISIVQLGLNPNMPNNSATLNGVYRTRGVARLSGRYVAPVVNNLNTNALKSTGNHTITLIPIPMEAQ